MGVLEAFGISIWHECRLSVLLMPLDMSMMSMSSLDLCKDGLRRLLSMLKSLLLSVVVTLTTVRSADRFTPSMEKGLTGGVVLVTRFSFEADLFLFDFEDVWLVDFEENAGNLGVLEEAAAVAVRRGDEATGRRLLGLPRGSILSSKFTKSENFCNTL